MTNTIEIPQKLVGISVSESPDLGALGLSQLHLDDAAMELCRIVLQIGGVPAYGGDLRKSGYTWQFAELVKRYADGGSGKPLQNFLAWPSHCTERDADLTQARREFDDRIRMLFLDPAGNILLPSKRRACTPATAPSDDDKPAMFSAMRQTMTKCCKARILVGGRVSGYQKGGKPGLAEEALLALEAKQPLFLIGGFGGCTRDIIATIQGAMPKDDDGWPPRTSEEIGDNYTEALRPFGNFTLAALNNELSPDENRILFTTQRLNTILQLTARGLRRCFNRR